MRSGGPFLPPASEAYDPRSAEQREQVVVQEAVARQDLEAVGGRGAAAQVARPAARFLDDQHIEMTLTNESDFPGQQVLRRVLKYKVLVDGDEMVLVDPEVPNHPTRYKRSP